jgi:hypothetical protein
MNSFSELISFQDFRIVKDTEAIFVAQLSDGQLSFVEEVVDLFVEFS